MRIAQSKLTSQGQISVPMEVRRKLGLGPGSVLDWSAEGDAVVVRRAARFSSAAIHEVLFGETPSRRSVAELKEGIRKRTRRLYARG